MAFFDKLSETIATKSKDIAQKTKDFAEISSLNSQINSQDDIIRNAYIEIGRSYFEEHMADENSQYEELFQKIKTAQSAIEEKKMKILQIKGVRFCDTCSAEIPSGSSFCPQCGGKVEVPEPVQAEEAAGAADTGTVAAKCPECGEELTPESAFCGSCGYKIQ